MPEYFSNYSRIFDATHHSDWKAAQGVAVRVFEGVGAAGLIRVTFEL
jgi:hypothetical protein